MQKAQAGEKSLEIDEKKPSMIRGRVTYVRGSVPLAEVKCKLSTISTESSTVTSSAAVLPTSPEPVAAVGTVSKTEIPVARSSTTDLAGAYQLANLEPGIYEVTVTPPKGWDYKVEPQSVELAPGEVKVADFTLVQIPLETIFHGKVFDGDGKPAKGARVGGVICSNSLEPATTVTESDGSFVIKNVVPGDRFARVMLSGHVSEMRDFSIEEGQTLSLDFALKKAAFKIEGVVTNRQGKPLIADVQLFEGGAMRAMVVQKSKTTDESGSFEFYVNEGQFSILIQAPGCEMGSWTDVVSENKKVKIELAEFDPRRHTHPVLSPTEAQDTMSPG